MFLILRQFITDLKQQALRLNEINSAYDDFDDDVPL